MDITKPDTFAMLKKTIVAYQKTVDSIAKAYPNTFTAQIFCAAEKLPEGSLTSLETLRKNFLQRDMYASSQFYSDFAPQRILLNYIAIRGNSNPDEPIETLMGITLKNPDAAKRTQEVMSKIFYRMHQEDLIIAYIAWADRNPDKMYDQSVKSRLQNLKKIVAGNQFIDFALNDTTGKPRKLSETVNSSK